LGAGIWPGAVGGEGGPPGVFRSARDRPGTGRARRGDGHEGESFPFLRYLAADDPVLLAGNVWPGRSTAKGIGAPPVSSGDLVCSRFSLRPGRNSPRTGIPRPATRLVRAGTHGTRHPVRSGYGIHRVTGGVVP